MLALLMLFTLGSINASNVTLKNGKYSVPEYGLEVHVQNSEPKTAKLYETVVPLTKNGDEFYGDTTDSGVKYSFVVTANTKRSIYTAIKIERTLPKIAEDRLYNFKDMGFEYLVSNSLIKKIRTGANKETVSEIDLDTDGTIAKYNITSTGNYSLDVDDSNIQKFECTGCTYNIVGNDNNGVEVSDPYNGLAYIKLKPTVVEFYRVDTGKQVINTYDGTHVDIDTYFYNGTSLLNTSTRFKVNQDDITFTMTSNFVLKKFL